MFTLQVQGQCWSQLYGFTIHLYAIFFAVASCTLHIALHIARLHALQKLVEKSTVSLPTCMSIAKHVGSSIEKAAQVYFVCDSRFPPLYVLNSL